MTKPKIACLAIALLLAGSVALQAAVPNLVGTWTGTGKGVGIEHGYYNVTYTVTVTDQNGNLFRGNIKITTPLGPETQKFTGIIKSDNTITANYRKYTGEKLTEALSFGKYIAPTAKKPTPGYEGCWINSFNQDTGTMSLTKK
jgi:hypothetical protein